MDSRNGIMIELTRQKSRGSLCILFQSLWRQISQCLKRVDGKPVSPVCVFLLTKF